jgi:hypothetical protein
MRGGPARHCTRVIGTGKTQLVDQALTQRGQPPSIGLPPGMPNTSIGKQPKPLQTNQKLRDLPRVLDTRTRSDLAIARTRPPRHTLQHPRSAIRQTHPQPHQRIGRRHPTQTTSHSPGRLGNTHLRHSTPKLTPRSRRPTIRQHNHPHQLVQQPHQRLPTRQPRLHNRKRRANHTLSRQRRRTNPNPTLLTTLIHHRRQPRRQPLTTLRQQRPTPRGLHHTYPRQHRLTIQKHQNPPQTHTHPLTPRAPRQPHRSQLPLHRRDHIVKQHRQTVIAIGELLIKSTTRHPRPTRHVGNRRTHIAKLVKRHHRRPQKPSTLQLRNPLTRQSIHNSTAARRPRTRHRAGSRRRHHTTPPTTPQTPTRPPPRAGTPPRSPRANTPPRAGARNPPDDRDAPRPRTGRLRRNSGRNPRRQEREREREMRQRQAGASSIAPNPGDRRSRHVYPSRNHAESTLPHRSRPSPSPNRLPCEALEVNRKNGQPRPDPMFHATIKYQRQQQWAICNRPATGCQVPPPPRGGRWTHAHPHAHRVARRARTTSGVVRRPARGARCHQGARVALGSRHRS